MSALPLSLPKPTSEASNMRYAYNQTAESMKYEHNHTKKPVRKPFPPVLLPVLLMLCCLLAAAPSGQCEAFGEDPAAMEQAAASVVRLEVYDRNGKQVGSGSGFCALDPGILITAAHVVSNMDHMLAHTEAGESFRIEHVFALDEESDIALCTLPEEAELIPLPVSETPPLRGERVTVIGSQFGLTNLITLGNLAGLWNMENTEWLLFTAPVSSGSSGGPLINDAGEVIGIVTGTYDRGQNMNIAASVRVIQDLYEADMAADDAAK